MSLTHHVSFQSVDYEHPIFDQRALDAQKQLWNLQGSNRTWYCGAYFGYGFHEDGLQSGLAVAEAVGRVKRPWTIENESGPHLHCRHSAPVIRRGSLVP